MTRPSESSPTGSLPEPYRSATLPGPDRLRDLAEALCWIVGVACLAWVAWAQLQSELYQRSRRAALEVRATEHPSEGFEEGIPSMSRPELPAPIEEGAALATVEIPRIGISAVVAEGTSEPVLRKAVGHLRRSAAPGSSGNVALAAHRDSFFRALVEAEIGDEILLSGPDFDDRYRVEWRRIVDPEDVEVVAPTDFPAVTLVTCYPPGWVGPAPQRLIVRGRLVESPG